MYQWTKPILQADREFWEERLETDVFPGMFFEEDVATAALRVVAVCHRREDAQAWMQQFGGEVTAFEDQDWVALGAQSWRQRSLPVGNRFLVALDEDPVFVGALQSQFPGRDLLVVPPEMAFGTGDHETTATCLELVEEFAAEHPRGWSLLDLGTGSAILAMAAQKAGAARALATELDQTALQVAARNLVRNGIPPGQIELRCEDVLGWTPGEQFDLICANLFAGILVQVIPKLPDALRPGGRACLSGILQEQESLIGEALQKAGLAVLRRIPRGKWVSFWLRGSNP